MVYCWCMRRVPHSHKVLLAGMLTYFPRRVSISCIGGVCSVCLSHMESCSLECPHISGCVCMYLVLVLSAVCAPVSWSLACWNVNIFPKACLYGVLFVCAVCAPVSWSLARWNVNIFPKACLYGVLFVCAVCAPVSWSLACWNVNIFPKACLYGVLFVCAVCAPVSWSLARWHVNIFPKTFLYGVLFVCAVCAPVTWIWLARMLTYFPRRLSTSCCPACGTSDLGLTASAPLLLWWEFSFYLGFKIS